MKVLPLSMPLPFGSSAAPPCSAGACACHQGYWRSSRQRVARGHYQSVYAASVSSCAYTQCFCSPALFIFPSSPSSFPPSLQLSCASHSPSLNTSTSPSSPRSICFLLLSILHTPSRSSSRISSPRSRIFLLALMAVVAYLHTHAATAYTHVYIYISVLMHTPAYLYAAMPCCAYLCVCWRVLACVCLCGHMPLRARL